MATDDQVQQLADRIGQLADAIDELVGSNTQLLDLLVRRLERDDDDAEPARTQGPVYLDDPAPAGGADVGEVEDA